MPRPQPAEAPDPLADLREPDVAQEPVSPPAGPSTPADAQEPVLDPSGDVDRIVIAWHTDPTAQSFGHSGGTCACGYLARVAVAALRGTA